MHAPHVVVRPQEFSGVDRLPGEVIDAQGANLTLLVPKYMVPLGAGTLPLVSGDGRLWASVEAAMAAGFEVEPAAPMVTADLAPLTAPDGWIHLPSLTWHELAAAASVYGLAPPESVVDLATIDGDALARLAAEHGHQHYAEFEAWEGMPLQPGEMLAGSHSTGAVELPVAQTAGLDPVPDPVADPIPFPLPTAKAELAQICAELGLTVKGTGSGGYRKEDDFVRVLEAERSRRLGAGE